VIVLFGDDLVDNPNGKNAIEQLIKIHEKTEKSVILLEEVPKEDTKKYGIVDIDMKDTEYGQIKAFVEKPDPLEAPSNLGVIGKFLITYDMLNTLGNSKPCKDGEIRLANAFIDSIKKGETVYGKILEGQRFDTGDKLGFLKATLHYALKKEHESVANALRNFLFNKGG